MITKNFQKLGALVASLVSIITLSSAAEAVVISSPAVTTPIGATNATGRMPTIHASAYSNATPLFLQAFNSVTINNLSLSTNARRLSATLSLVDVNDANTSFGSVQLFTGTSGTGSGIPSGNYRFEPASASTQAWPTNGYLATTTYALNPAESSQFDGIDLNGKQWQLDLTNGIMSTTSNGTGSLTGFSVDATVPFESDAAPAGAVIVFGAFVLRRKLQQRSARMMSLESVNS